MSLTPGPSRKTPWRFALRTDADAFGRFWQARPEPGFHDIFGLVKIGRGRIDGDILTLVKNLRFFKEDLGLDRPVLAGCLMGGRIAFQLAALHPDKFSGAGLGQHLALCARCRALEHALDVHA